MLSDGSAPGLSLGIRAMAMLRLDCEDFGDVCGGKVMIVVKDNWVMKNALRKLQIMGITKDIQTKTDEDDIRSELSSDLVFAK